MKRWAFLIILIIAALSSSAGCLQEKETPNDKKLAIQPYNSQFTIIHYPEQLYTNSYALINVTTRNLGSKKWNVEGGSVFHISYHWLQGNNTVVWDGLRSELPENVSHGETIVVEVLVLTPERAGNYTLVIDCVEEGVTWFEAQNSTPLRKDIQILPLHEEPIHNNNWNYSTDFENINELKNIIDATLESSAITYEGRTGRVFGLHAGSSYPQIWIRDSATILPLSRYLYQEKYLNSWIEEFLKHQSENGSIMDYISPMNIDKNTVETDQESSLVDAAYQFYTITGNEAWLNKEIRGITIIDRLDKALQWVFEHRYDENSGLVVGAYTADWGDVQFEDSPGTDITERTHWTCDIYDNALMYRACNELSDMHAALGDKKRALFWKEKARIISRNMSLLLWNATGGYYSIHYLVHDESEIYNDSHIFAIGGNAEAIRSGCANESQIKTIFIKEREILELNGTPPFGCVLYPPYPPEFFCNTIMDEEFEYQNGGLWDWFAARFILAEYENGFSSEATTHLCTIADRDIAAGGLYEWYTPDGEARGSPNYAGSAGVLGQCIIEGYFGIQLSADALTITPRLGGHNGSITLHEPVTGTSISYTHTWIPEQGIILDYDGNYPKQTLFSILLPEKTIVKELYVDGTSQKYSIMQKKSETAIVFDLEPGPHQCRIYFE